MVGSRQKSRGNRLFKLGEALFLDPERSIHSTFNVRGSYPNIFLYGSVHVIPHPHSLVAPKRGLQPQHALKDPWKLWNLRQHFLTCTLGSRATMSHPSTSALLLVDQAVMENVSVQHDWVLLKDLLRAVSLVAHMVGKE